MSRRLEPLHPGELTPAQKAVYDHIARGTRTRNPQVFVLTDEDGRLNGSFNAMLLAPAVGDALQALGTALRYRSSLSGSFREMAVLDTATHWDRTFLRQAHEALARAAGLAEEEVALRADLPALHPSSPRECSRAGRDPGPANRAGPR